WEKEKPETTLTEYGRTAEGEAAERWRTSPLYRLFTSGESLLRLRLTAETEAEFPSLAELRLAKLGEGRKLGFGLRGQTQAQQRFAAGEQPIKRARPPAFGGLPL